MTRLAASPALLYVPAAAGSQVRFRVVAPDNHPIAVTVEPDLAAVIDLRGGTGSARKRATAVGHSEGLVRTRLALLPILDAPWTRCMPRRSPSTSPTRSLRSLSTPS